MRKESFPFPHAVDMDRERLIDSAYDIELLDRCGKLLTETITKHFADLQSGKLPVQDWRRPQDNISDALNWLDQAESNPVLAELDEAARRVSM